MANPEDRQVWGTQKTSLGLLAGGHKLQANWGEAAFSPPRFCQQGTPGNPRSRRGRKTWRKTNLRLLLPPGKTKKEKKTMEEELRRGCSTSRDLPAASRVLCFRGVCSGYLAQWTSLSTTRPQLQSSPGFLYSSLPLESRLLPKIRLSVLDHCFSQ